MNSNTSRPRLLGISGSLRKASLNTAILRTVASAMRERADIELFSLEALPLYNGDLDGDEKPAAVTAFKDAITAADGLVIVSPEYNYSMPGVLKNAIDWASRPGFNSPLKGKKFAVMTSSMAFTGGVRAQAPISNALQACLAVAVPGPQVVIGVAHEKVRDGVLVDEPSLKFACEAVDRLIAAL